MKYVIVGNGVAGITAALKLRERNNRAAITVISDESDYFFSRTALMYAYMDRMTLRDLEPFERKVYGKQKIQRVRGKVTGIDASRQHIEMESGPVEYDQLLLATGSIARPVDLAGSENVKNGIVNFVSLNDLASCERQTRSGMNAVVAGGGLIGIELTECLLHNGAKVTYLVREPWYMAPKLSEAEGRMVEEEIKHHGVNLITGESAVSVESNQNGELTGIATDAGNKIECALLGICVGVQPNIEWLKDSRRPPEMKKGIVVDGGFRTSLPEVYACGDCAEVKASPGESFVEQLWYTAKRQGGLAALSMLGDSIDYRQPIFYNSAKLFEVEYTIVGVMADEEQAEEFYVRIPGKRVSIRIHESSGAVQGFSMLGSRWDHTRFERWVQERRSLDYVIEHLQEAQFDVEFGRQTLAAVRAEYKRYSQLVA